VAGAGAAGGTAASPGTSKARGRLALPTSANQHLKDRLCGATGVMRVQGTEGATMGPPAGSSMGGWGGVGRGGGASRGLSRGGVLGDLAGSTVCMLVSPCMHTISITSPR
jgi:hypothetical protein